MPNTQTVVGSKVCNICRLELPTTQFYQTKKSQDGLLTRCKECHKAAVSARQKERPDICNANTRAYKKRHPERVRLSEKRRLNAMGVGKRSIKYRRNDLMRNYGVTPGWFTAKLAEQGGGCALCGSKVSRAANRNLHVDHNHDTNFVRGILCHHCNACLMAIEQDKEWAARAQAYLDRYEAEWEAEMAARYGNKS